MKTGIATILCAAAFAAYGANPSYKWTGNAGNGLWSDPDNWINTDTSVAEVPAAGATGGNNATIIDFTDLEENGTITFDSSTQYYIRRFTFGSNKGTQTIARNPSATGYIKAITAATEFIVGDGTTVDFAVNKPQLNDDGGCRITYSGGGTFRWTSEKLSAHRWCWFIEANTTVAVNTATADLSTLYLNFKASTAKFSLGADMKIGTILGTDAGASAAGQILLNGHTLEIGSGNGEWLEGWLNSAKARIWTDIAGSGKIIYSGATTVTNVFAPTATGTVRIMNSDVVMPSGQTFDPSVSVQIDNSGILTFNGSQTLAALSGTGTGGGVDIASGAKLSFAGPAAGATNTYSAKLLGGGTLEKTGAGTFVMEGAGDSFGGTVSVKAGTVAVKGGDAAVESAPYRYHAFEDNLNDTSGNGKAALESNYYVSGDSTTPPSGEAETAYCAGRNGTRGIEMYSGSFATVKIYHEALSGEGPFSASFWIVPDRNICRSDVNYNMTMMMFFGNGGMTAYKTLQIYLIKGTNISFRVGGYTTVPATAPLGFNANLDEDVFFDGDWHMISVTYSGADGGKTLTGYFDGEPVGSIVLDGGTLNLVNGRCQLGWGQYGSLAGKFDDFKILSRCQSAAEVKADFTGAVVPAADKFAALPAPVAKWTFDDPENPGRDTSGNGYHLSAPDGYFASCESHEGAFGMALATNSVLSWPAGTAFPENFPTGNSPWTLSVRFQLGNLIAGSKYANPAMFTWGDPFFGGPADYALADGHYFSAAIRNNDGYRYYRAGAKFDASKYTDITLMATNVTYSGITGRQAWTHLVYTFRPGLGGGVSIYQDGRLVAYQGKTSMVIEPEEILVGLRPKYANSSYYEPTPFMGNIDDIRVFNEVFDADQVLTLVRGLETESIPPALSAGASVEVSSGASLDVNGTGAAAKSVSGEGTLNVAEDSSISVGDLRIGELSGRGQVSSTGALVAGDTSAWFGYATLSSPLSISVADESELPAVSISGRIELPATGTVTFTSAPSSNVSDSVVAEAGTLILPDNLDGWSVVEDTGAQSYCKFYVKDGKLRLKRSVTGLTIFVR